MSKPMLRIGASKAAVKAARAAVMDILKATCGDTVKETALKAFVQVCQVRNASVSGCQFTTKEK